MRMVFRRNATFDFDQKNEMCSATLNHISVVRFNFVTNDDKWSMTI
jgi:hypothetical protein